MSSFFELSPDVKYETYDYKIPVDKSGGFLRVCRTNPVSNPASLGYNSSSNTISFLISCSKNMSQYLRSCAFVFKCHAESSVGTFPNNGVDPATVGIDWDPCCMIKNISFKVNGRADPYIEQYQTSLFPIANKIRLLTELSRDVLNYSSDMLYTPCMENGQDTTTALTTETVARSRTWLTKQYHDGQGNLINGVIFHSKVLPLPMLSSFVASCDAMYEIEKFEVLFEFQAQSNVLFQLPSNTSQNLFIIDSIECLYTEVSNQLFQEQLQTMRRVGGDKVQRIAYLYPDIIELQYVRNMTLQKSTAKNVQSVVLAFSATTSSATSINPYQFVRNGIVQINSKYGASIVPLRPIELDPVNPATANEIYYYYKLLQKKSAIENFVPAIDFYRGYCGNWGSTVKENYHLYCLPFTSTDIFRKMDEGTIYINTVQSPTNSADQIPCYVLAWTAKFMQINTDGSISVIS